MGFLVQIPMFYFRKLNNEKTESVCLYFVDSVWSQFYFWIMFMSLLVCVASLISCCISQEAGSIFSLFPFLLIFMWNSDEKDGFIALTACRDVKRSKTYSW